MIEHRRKDLKLALVKQHNWTSPKDHSRSLGKGCTFSIKNQASSLRELETIFYMLNKEVIDL